MTDIVERAKWSLDRATQDYDSRDEITQGLISEIERLRALVDVWVPKIPQVRAVLRDKLGKRVTGPARILSKRPSSYPPSAKPPRKSP